MQAPARKCTHVAPCSQWTSIFFLTRIKSSVQTQEAKKFKASKRASLKSVWRLSRSDDIWIQRSAVGFGTAGKQRWGTKTTIKDFQWGWASLQHADSHCHHKQGKCKNAKTRGDGKMRDDLVENENKRYFSNIACKWWTGKTTGKHGGRMHDSADCSTRGNIFGTPARHPNHLEIIWPPSSHHPLLRLKPTARSACLSKTAQLKWQTKKLNQFSSTQHGRRLERL